MVNRKELPYLTAGLRYFYFFIPLNFYAGSGLSFHVLLHDIKLKI